MKNKLEFLTDQMGHRWEKFDAKELEHHVWDVYRNQPTPTWYWDKFNLVGEQRFYWDQYAVQSDSKYNWQQYERIDELVQTNYYWDKHEVKLTDQYPSWEKETLDSDPMYFWKQYKAVQKIPEAGEGNKALKITGHADSLDITSYYHYFREVYTQDVKDGIWAIPLSKAPSKEMVEALPMDNAPSSISDYIPTPMISDSNKYKLSSRVMTTWNCSYTNANNGQVDKKDGTREWLWGNTAADDALTAALLPGQVIEGLNQYIPAMSWNDRDKAIVFGRPQSIAVNKKHENYTDKPTKFTLEICKYEPSLIESDKPWFQTDRTVYTQIDLLRYLTACGLNVDRMSQSTYDSTYRTQRFDGLKADAYIQEKSQREIYNALKNVFNTISDDKVVMVVYGTLANGKTFGDTGHQTVSGYVLDRETVENFEYVEINEDNSAYLISSLGRAHYNIEYYYAQGSQVSSQYTIIPEFIWPTVGQQYLHCYYPNMYSWNNSVQNMSAIPWVIIPGQFLGYCPLPIGVTTYTTEPRIWDTEKQEWIDVLYYDTTSSLQYSLLDLGRSEQTYDLINSNEIPPNVKEYKRIELDNNRGTIVLYYDDGENGTRPRTYTYYITGWSDGTIQWGPGSYIKDVSDKDRNKYPTVGYQDGFWYVYDREQITHLYGKTCVYSDSVDTQGYVSIVDKPVLDRNTGLFEYELGGDGQYLMNANTATSWIQVLPDGKYLFWQSMFNDGSLMFDYGEYIGAQSLDSKYYQQTDVVLNILHSAGQFINHITTNSKDSFPENGEEDGYWYILIKEEPIINTYRGEYIKDVSYMNQFYYPNNGPMDDYWYVYIDKTTINSRGQYEGSVSSSSASAFPANGIYNGQWYTYTHTNFINTKGEYLETVSSTSESDFPKDGIKGYYWYILSDYKVNNVKQEKVDQVDTTDPDAYPQDTPLGGYWYERVDHYTRVDPIRYAEDVWSTSANAYPTDGVASDGFWYKYVGQRYIPKYIIGDNQLKGGVKYKQEVNTSEDYVPGDVGCAEIQFTIFTEPKEAQKYLDLECDYLYRMRDEDGWTRVGHFTITTASDKTATTTDLRAYDNIIKSEKIVDDFVKNTKYPIRLKDYFMNLCSYCGLTGVWGQGVTNEDFLVKNNFTTNQITARQILGLIAEVAAGFIKAEEDGTIKICGYTAKHDLFDERKFKDVTQAIYETQDITGLNVAKSSDDLGVSVGSDEVLFRIIDNPLLYIEDEHEIDGAMANIFSIVSKVRYTPVEMTIYDPNTVQCGDIITVKEDRAYVMGREWDGSTVKIFAKGQRERSVDSNPIDGSIDALRGKSNELKRTLDETNSRITDVEAGLRSEISQTTREIRAEIENTKEGLESQLKLTADSLSATIKNNKDELEGRLTLTAQQFQTSIEDTKKELQSSITQTSDSITAQITQQGNVITQISQRLDGIKLVYNSKTGTASITIGDITVSELVDGTYVSKQIAGIDMTGYVRFNDLERTGSTVINGSNITTGTIDAARINMRGAITWSDLSQSLQNTISSSGGGSDPVTGLPSYIKETYIDATTIYSPNIYGGKFIARTGEYDGYMEMTPNGLNLYSSYLSRATIGLGYLSNGWNEPFITLGKGIDNYGTDTGLIKKYANGLWIGDTDDISSTAHSPSRGTGIFINFTNNTIYKYIDGSVSTL